MKQKLINMKYWPLWVAVALNFIGYGVLTTQYPLLEWVDVLFGMLGMASVALLGLKWFWSGSNSNT